MGEKPKSDLIKKRQEERHASDADAREETAADGRAEGSNPEQAQLQEGKLRLQRVQAVAEHQRKGHDEQPDDFARRKRVFAENLEHIGKQRDAGAEKDEAHEIERWRLLLPIVGQMEIDHQ